jgi:hypothetical protein
MHFQNMLKISAEAGLTGLAHKDKFYFCSHDRSKLSSWLFLLKIGHL